MDRSEEIKRVVQLGKPNDILKRWCKANEKGGFDLQGQLNLSDVIYLLSENERLRIENKELKEIAKETGEELKKVAPEIWEQIMLLHTML